MLLDDQAATSGGLTTSLTINLSAQKSLPSPTQRMAHHRLGGPVVHSNAFDRAPMQFGSLQRIDHPHHIVGAARCLPIVELSSGHLVECTPKRPRERCQEKVSGESVGRPNRRRRQGAQMRVARWAVFKTPIPRPTPGAFIGGPIQARSVSDCVGTTIDVAPCVASDPPAYAGGLYGEGERASKPGAWPR
jgi:hypothetical protein